MQSLGRLTNRARWWILAIAAGFIVVAAVLGGGVTQVLRTGGFDDPGSESSRAKALLDSVFDGGSANLVLLVSARTGSVDAPAVAARGRDLTNRLAAEPGVTGVVSYWSPESYGALRSEDAGQALILGRIAGTDDEARDRVEALSKAYSSAGPIVSVMVGGSPEVSRQIGSQVEEDLVRAEMLSLPVTLLLLLLVFGSVVAAGLPLTIGVVAILGTFLVLRTLAAVTDVSIFALNLTTGLGLGLAIDYSLFILSRYREELRSGREYADALARTVATAGRTVLFSAATVAISLSVLLLFPLMFLRSFAYAGIAVVGLAAVAAVVLLPALLAVLKGRVDSWRLFRRPGADSEGSGFWHGLATFVMRRPVPLATAVVLILLVLGSPFLRASFGMPDYRVLPADASSREVQEDILAGFATEEFNAFPVVLTGTEAVDPNSLDAYAAALSGVEGVARVDGPGGSYAGGERVAAAGLSSERYVSRATAWLSVVPAIEPLSGEGEQLVEDVRALPSPEGAQVLVGGASAQLVDSKDAIFSRVPLAAGIVAAVTFALLFVMTGSVIVPLKAIVLNLLSLSATFGAMVWVFQDGNLSGLLGFESTGIIDMSIPILMFCVAFGLSMDYEVFLLSRIREAYERSHDNTAAVAQGLERTGRIVTAAAVLLAVVFVAFATSEIVFIKMLGLGLALAVLMDATIIRGILVPAFMRLMGDLNWWAPPVLQRLHRRIGVSEAESAERRHETRVLESS